MSTLLKMLFVTSLLLSGQVSFATPQADARFIMQRNVDEAWMAMVHRKFKEAFVISYFRPISEFGVEIADMDRFVDLIPDEDIAPYVDRLMSKTIELYLKVYTPEELATIAAVMRVDKEATINRIVSEDYEQQYAIALKEARAKAQSSGADDPLVADLEELTVNLEALVTTLEGDHGKAIGQEMALGLGQLSTLMYDTREIMQIEQKPYNPIALAALGADGILSFASLVQQKTLLRQLSVSKRTGGIRFEKPPGQSTLSN